MVSGRSFKRWRSRVLRWATVAVGLVAYLAAVLGFPVLQPSRKAGGLPFPCQDHPCGCMTADDCWANCCCFSKQERLAWAREHQVEVPASLAWNAPRQRDIEARKHVACS